MNNKRIEMISVTKLKDYLNNCEYIVGNICENDKTPSWDGEIEVYSNTELNKESMHGKVPIQVKGKKVDILSIDKRSYPVEIADLKNYSNDGGVIFFVIEIIDNKRYKIFYNLLLSLDIARLLEGVKKGQQRRSIKLLEINIDEPNEILDLCLQFISEKKKQYSFQNFDQRLLNLKENNEVFDSFVFNVYSNKKDIFEKLLGQSVYVYGRTNIRKNINIDVPIDKINIKQINIKNINSNVVMNKRVYYDKCEVTIDKISQVIQLGQSIKLLSEGKIKFNESGTLSERIKDTKFMIDLLNYNKFNIGDELFECNNIDLDQGELIEHLSYMQNVSDLLKKLNVTSDLNVDKLQDKDINMLNILIQSILEEKTINLEDNTDFTGIKIVKISNINLILMCKKDTNNEQYEICNFFDTDIENLKGKLIIEKNNEFEVSLYILLKKNDLLNCDNVNYESITQSIIKIPYSEVYGARVNKLLLEIISVYDELPQNNEILECAIKIADWLIENKDDEDINFINYVQILKRQNKMTQEHRSKLMELRNKTNNNLLLMGISIVLDNIEDSLFYYDRLKEEEKQTIKEAPIFKLIDSDSRKKFK